MTSPTPTQPGRTATNRERSLLARYGTPVRLPIDDAVTPPLSTPRGERCGRTAAVRGNNSPAQPAPPTRPTIRPAALGPRVDNGHTNLTTIPGMLANEVRIPRPKIARLEAAAEPVYQILGHEARVLLRLLDHAIAPMNQRINHWAVPWETIVQAFSADDLDEWEAIAAAHKAIDELSELQIACIIPGHVSGVNNESVPVLFICEHAHRQMLRSIVLFDPDAIDRAIVGYAALLLARESLMFHESISESNPAA